MQTNSKKIYFFDTLDSTMNKARELAIKGARDFTIVVAKKQTQGKGRLKREWLSDEGGLYLTIILRPSNIEIKKAPLMNFAISLSIYRAIKKLFGIETKLKWPNDILLDGKKVCGILSEIKIEDDKIKYLNVGIGLNVNNLPLIKERETTSLMDKVKKKLDIEPILLSILQEFKYLNKNIDFKKIVTEWKKKAILFNKKVRIVTLKEEIFGTIENIDEESGALILKDREEEIAYGDMFFIDF